MLVLTLLLGVLSTLVLAGSDSSSPSSSLTSPTTYNNCSGDYPHPLLDNVASLPYYKPQIRINPLEINNNGTGWEEWLFIGHNRLPDASELLYGFKFALGDPTSANVSHFVLIVWALFPNGTYYHDTSHDIFTYEESTDGGFTYTIGGSNLGYDPVSDHWNISISLNGYVIQSITQNVAPGIPYAPDYQGKVGQISEGFYSRVDAPRAHSDGTITFPWGLQYPIASVGSLKHTWSNEIMADAISAYVRGTTFLPNTPPEPIVTYTWFQAWDNAGKEVASMQYLAQPDGVGDGQVFRLQITDSPDTLSIVTTPQPVGLPLSYNSTEITVPLCGPGADYNGQEKMTWTAHNVFTMFNFIDFANGSTIYQRVNMTGHVWSNGTAVDVAGGVGVVEVYHR